MHKYPAQPLFTLHIPLTSSLERDRASSLAGKDSPSSALLESPYDPRYDAPRLSALALPGLARFDREA